MYTNEIDYEVRYYYYCDSPGFGDSAGTEVDIANVCGMINALHKANSVKIVVIIAHDSLTAKRMSGAIEIS